jgi:hypothetical protein
MSTFFLIGYEQCMLVMLEAVMALSPTDAVAFVQKYLPLIKQAVLRAGSSTLAGHLDAFVVNELEGLLNCLRASEIVMCDKKTPGLLQMAAIEEVFDVVDDDLDEKDTESRMERSVE